MHQKDLKPEQRAQLDAYLADLEQKIVREPGNLANVNVMVTLLESYQPQTSGVGAYSDCQRLLFELDLSLGPKRDLSKAEPLREALSSAAKLLDDHSINPSLNVYQAFIGKMHYINGVYSDCAQRLALFNKESVISKLCTDCYKVQVLPLNFMALLQTHFVLRHLELPRDNFRKSMIELRKAVPNAYKGYIYCQSEEEATHCRGVLMDAFAAAGVTDIVCALSHGCSEYGLTYPGFKFSADGAHRDFERPPQWDRREAQFAASYKAPQQYPRHDYNMPGLSIRDILCFRAWYQYARLIGDSSCEEFAFLETGAVLPGLIKSAEEQVVQRQSELAALRARASQAA